LKIVEANRHAALGDKLRLGQVLNNLINNAIKYSPGQEDIHITATVKNKQVKITVKDHGIGISNADQKHLMERFFRGANAVHIQGTGLGLHIVSRYAELLNGTVECKSELERGTEFIITFRIKKKTR